MCPPRHPFPAHPEPGETSLLPRASPRVLAAATLLGGLVDRPLLTLDAIHLIIGQAAGLTELATADRMMAAAAADLGLGVARFD